MVGVLPTIFSLSLSLCIVGVYSRNLLSVSLYAWCFTYYTLCSPNVWWVLSVRNFEFSFFLRMMGVLLTKLCVFFSVRWVFYLPNCFSLSLYGGCFSYKIFYVHPSLCIVGVLLTKG